jgi:hypothetical protein
MGAVVLDTSVVLALFDPEDAQHALRGQSSGRGRTSRQEDEERYDDAHPPDDSESCVARTVSGAEGGTRW